ncbi:hypothetical protein [Ilumatobacter sp.]|uniref:hypothetical protein n=1 Tax=Ilumatobacter sp. TaxID=1967498 RepID=UPI003B5223D5
MRVEEQLRAYGRTIEQHRSPIEATEIVNDEIVVVDGAAGQARRRSSRWINAAAAAAVLVAGTIGLLALAGNDREPSAPLIDLPSPVPTIPPTTTPATTPATTTTPGTTLSTITPATERSDTTTTGPPTMASVLSDVLGADAAAIGETVTFDDGEVARVDAVAVDARARNDLYTSDDDPGTVTELEIERCLGDDAATNVDESSERPLYTMGLNHERFVTADQWIAVLDDGTPVSARPAYHPVLMLEPGGCVRAYLAIPTPDDTNVVGLLLLPDRCCIVATDGEFSRRAVSPQDVARALAGWDLTAEPRAIDGPLRPIVPPATVAIGEPIETGYSLYDITVNEVIEDAAPRPNGFDLLGALRPELPPQPEPGRELVEVRADICIPPDRPDFASFADRTELHWLIVTDDNYIGTATPERLNGTAGAKEWDASGRGTWLDPPINGIGNLLPDGFVESISRGDFEGVPSRPEPGECLSGYVQIDLPVDAVLVDIVVAYGQGMGEWYGEVGRVRINDPG